MRVVRITLITGLQLFQRPFKSTYQLMLPKKISEIRVGNYFRTTQQKFEGFAG